MKTNLSKWLLIGLTSTTIISCMTATKYGEVGSYYGNSIKEDPKNKGIFLSSFNGNEFTGSYSSMDYSELGALEYCAKKSQYAFMSNPVDQSFSSTSLNAYSNSYTVNKTTYTNYNMVPVTTTYPSHTIVFQCKSKLYTLDGVVDTEIMSREMVHAVTKDFKAGVLLKDIQDEKNKNELKKDDIIIKVNNVRVESLTEIGEVLEKLNKKSVSTVIIRESKIKTVNAKILDITSAISEIDLEIAEKICAEKPIQSGMRSGGPSSATSANGSMSSPAKEEVDPFKTACATVKKFLKNN